MRTFLRTVLALAVLAGTSLGYDGIAIEKGRAASRALNRTLREKVKASMAEVGPSGTVAVCYYQAQALAGEVSANEGVTVRRTSLRIRNPRNAPDPYEKQLLARLETLHREGNLPAEVFEEQVTDGRRVYRYAKPLLVEPMCLTCHGRGEEIPEGVRRELEVRYPDDAATGYRPGDLRGIVSVIIPKE